MHTPRTSIKVPRLAVVCHISEVVPLALKLIAEQGGHETMPLADAPAGHVLHPGSRPGAITKATR